MQKKDKSICAYKEEDFQCEKTGTVLLVDPFSHKVVHMCPTHCGFVLSEYSVLTCPACKCNIPTSKDPI